MKAKRLGIGRSLEGGQANRAILAVEESGQLPRNTTPSYVRNIIRRGLIELVDPRPGDKDVGLVWAHFDSSCAYCGCSLKREAREGRIDHSRAASQGGPNAIGNRVLACGPCNDDEKLDQHWEAFLRVKVQADDLFEARRQRILEWQTRNPLADEVRHTELTSAAMQKAAEVIKVLDEKVRELGLLMRETR